MFRSVFTPGAYAMFWLGTTLAPAELPATESSGNDEVKRILPVSTAEEGSNEVTVYSEYSTLNFEYEALGRSGEERSFTAEDFHSWTTELQFDFGIAEDFELSFVLPLISSHFTASDQDRFSRARQRDVTGIGDAEVTLGYGLESEDETLLGLISIGVELPTNTLPDFFGGPGTAAVGSLELEKYFGKVGFISGLETQFSDDNTWEFEYLLGVAVIPTDRIYSQILFARFPEENLNRVEASIEYLLSNSYSVEWMASRELSGENETIIGMGITVFFGEGEAEDSDD